jgi:hypothetical protein
MTGGLNHSLDPVSPSLSTVNQSLNVVDRVSLIQQIFYHRLIHASLGKIVPGSGNADDHHDHGYE